MDERIKREPNLWWSITNEYMKWKLNMEKNEG